MQQLAKTMGKVERRPLVNLIRTVPIVWSDHPLIANALLEIRVTSARCLTQQELPKALPITIPVNVRMLMTHRRKKIQRAHALRRERRIGYARVLNVERRVLGENVLIFDLIQVPLIILGNM